MGFNRQTLSLEGLGAGEGHGGVEATAIRATGGARGPGAPELGVDRQGSLHTATPRQPPAHSIPAPASPASPS